ncbi:hypothetical protein BGX38DRAFT_1144921 [Terfezia claveryi]|nr:hypothetical protein BGX38DRAFT_1144921 [Terfezia claveryi]
MIATLGNNNGVLAELVRSDQNAWYQKPNLRMSNSRGNGGGVDESINANEWYRGGVVAMFLILRFMLGMGIPYALSGGSILGASFAAGVTLGTYRTPNDFELRS